MYEHGINSIIYRIMVGIGGGGEGGLKELGGDYKSV